MLPRATTAGNSAARLAAIDADLLTPIVRSALQTASVDLVRWRFSQIHGGAGGGARASAVYRCSGHALDQGNPRPWSIVLKVLQARDGDSPSASHYWRREADVYLSGLLEKTLPAGMAAPRCIAVAEHPGESIWLWLEDVTDEIGLWSLGRYGLIARQLGKFNADYLTGRQLPDWPWLSTNWIRCDLLQIGAQIDQFTASLQIPLVRRFFPGDAGAKVIRLWSEREKFLAVLDRLPATLCHYDAFRRNLFARRRDQWDQTVLIDWAFLGIGPLGAEIVSPVWVTLVFCEVDAAQAQELSDVVVDGYLSGLRDSGWRGDEGLVRLGYMAAIAIRRLATIGYMLPDILDESRHPEVERALRLGMGEWADRCAEAGRFIEAVADQARDLINEFRFAS